MTAWLLSHLKLVAGAGVVLALLFAIWLADRHGYQQCKTDDTAHTAAALIVDQQKGNDALTAAMLQAQAANDQKAKVTNEISANHDKDADAPAAPVIQSTIRGLYASPAGN